MIAVTKSVKQLDELESIHQRALDANADWTQIWEMFYESPWFLKRLDFSARKLIHKLHFPNQWKEDIKQEALLVFARSIQRNRSLGFDTSRGSYGAFLSTIIYRCCQKGLRQFNHHNNQKIDEEHTHPFEDVTEQVDEHLDLQHCLDHLPEPYKMTVTMICEGKTILQIARKTKRSVRTVYRWIDKATELLRQSWEEQDR
jgi:DNA-directed RNA polymerase specialized sigma24 family protein